MNALQIFVSNHNPNLYLRSPSSIALSYHICSPSTIRFDSFPAVVPSVRFLALDLDRRPNLRRSFVAFAASHKGSVRERTDSDRIELDMKIEELQEAWRQTLEYFKKQSVKLQGQSNEAYEAYSTEAMEILMDASKRLMIQARTSSHDLDVEDGKESPSVSAADKNPGTVKEMVEFFISAVDELPEIVKEIGELKEASETRDFHVGIPCGLVLSVCGLLFFMVTGSISGIHFGLVLGGPLLALSIASRRLWKRGEASASLLRGQAAMAIIIFSRATYNLFSQTSSRFTSKCGLIFFFFSAMSVGFYLKKLIEQERNKVQKTNS